MVNSKARSASIDDAEVARFDRLAADWWDVRGPMAALHKFNPLRLVYIRDQAAARFDRDPKKLDSLKGLRILDIGCGGGILSEPLARLGPRWSAPTRPKRTSRLRAHMRKPPASMSTTAPPRRRLWPRRANNSTLCWRWKWSSTSSM
jgi:hypothetical protein